MMGKRLCYAVVVCLCWSGVSWGQDDIFSDGFEWGSTCAWSNDLWYPDIDVDLFGDELATGIQSACPPPAGMVDNNQDCDDTRSECTTDCVTDLDGDLVPDCRDTCIDVDQDMYGLGVDCLGQDCNDGNFNINPGAAELCDDLDNDCTPPVDEGCDDDFDDFCDVGMVIVGTPAVCPGGSGDCNDLEVDVFPGQTAWFSTPSSTGWDYDCDSMVTWRYQSQSSGCAPGSGGNCDGTPGYLGMIPGCGTPGTFLTGCSVDWLSTIPTCPACASECESGATPACINCITLTCAGSIVCDDLTTVLQQLCH